MKLWSLLLTVLLLGAAINEQGWWDYGE